jgi:hypothetical protein
MKAHTASLINAICLVGLSLWGYLSSESPSETALIPTGVGAALLIMYPWVKKENKVVAHIAVLLTLLILGGLVKPLTGAISRADNMAILRISIMAGTTILALAMFVKSFIDARKKRAQSSSGQ